MIAKALKSRSHPIEAQIIPIRGCNLSCTYCNEFDSSSKPVPTEEMIRRVDLLAALGTATVTISGGEPLLHPELEQIIRTIRSHGMLAGLITNGYLLTARRIKQLNDADLDHLQISIDNVNPDNASKKSLRVLQKKLRLLAEDARFDVNVNSVVGSLISTPEDALIVTQCAIDLGFASTVGLIHNDSGVLQPLSDRQQTVYKQIEGLKKPFHTAALSTASTKISLAGSLMIGTAGPAVDIYIFAKTDSYTTVRNSGATLAYRSKNMARRILSASTTPSKAAHLFARFLVFSAAR